MAVADQANRLADKTAFYNELALLDEDDDILDKGLQGSMQALSSAVIRKSRPVASPETMARDFAVETSTPASSLKMLGNMVTQTPVDPLRKSLARTLLRSNTGPEKTAAPSTPVADVEVVKDTPFRSQASTTQVPQLRHSISTPLPIKAVATSASATASTSKVLGKRKRLDTVKLVPEEQRIFSGLGFFFIPNDDIAAARRLRIRKAIEYGATRITEWDSTVTHVIVDKALSYQDVLKYLRLTQLPETVIMVTETYPADCVSYRTMLPPSQPQYRVNGSEQAQIAMPPPTLRTSSSEATQRSLQIKAVKAKEDVVVQPRTPSRTDESSVEAFRQQVAELTQDSVAVASMSPEKQRRKSSLDSGSDALEAVLEQARAGGDFEESDSENDEQGGPHRATEDLIDSDNNDERPPPESPRRLRKTSSTESTSSRTGKQTYACMRGGSVNTKDETPNPNSRTIEILQQMATHYDQMRDQWRTRAYRQAISTLRNHPTKVTSAEEAARLPNISTRLAAKIEEIVWTNRLRRLDSTKDEPADQALQLFAKIYGVGLAQASKWVQAGLRTLEDLTTRSIPLTENQKIGLAHFGDFNIRIPRAEVAQHGEIVRRALLAIDPQLQATVGGSYRRGARDSGDIDIVITKPGADASYLRTVVLENLVPELFKQGFLKAGLATTDKDSGSKWHGASQLPIHISTGMLVNPYPWRRIDFLLVPWDEIGAAMIYFTGNDIFNRSMRLLARRKGMRLNQRGLYKDVIRGQGGTKLTEGVRIEGQDERRIFELLGVKWREATDRNC